jgi:hypothetical protein
MRRWERELREMVGRVADNFKVERTKAGHFRVTIEGPKGREVAFCGGVLKDVTARKNIRADLRRRAAHVGAKGLTNVQDR